MSLTISPKNNKEIIVISALNYTSDVTKIENNFIVNFILIKVRNKLSLKSILNLTKIEFYSFMIFHDINVAENLYKIKPQLN